MVSIPFRKLARIPPCWYLILLVAVVFFRLDSGELAASHNHRWRFMLYSYDEKYCDLSAVLAWMDLDHQGVDTRLQCPICPCAPTPMNYGAGVLWLGRLGLYRITTQGAIWLGPLVIVCFLVALASVLAKAPVWQTPYYALLLFSPPVFLALERANLDILIFALLVLAVSLDRRLGNQWSYSLVFVAGALKYFPFIAATAFLRPTRRGWTYFGAMTGAVALFIVTTLRYIATAHAPDVARYGWGFPAMFKLLPEFLGAHQIVIRPWAPWQVLLPIVVSIAVVVIAGWMWRQPLHDALGADTAPRLLFLTGSAVYAACFAISANYEYRGIFLLLLTPQLFWMSQQKGYVRHLGWWGLGTTLAAFTLSWFKGNDWCAIGYQVSYWLLFCLCGALSAAVAWITLEQSQPLLAPPVANAGRTKKRRVQTYVPEPRRARIELRSYWPHLLILCAVLASGSTLYWLQARTLAPDNLIDEPGFNEGAKAWTLGTVGWGGCSAAFWDYAAGNPAGAVILNSCGQKTANPFAAQTLSGLIPGNTYELTFDWALYSLTGVSGGGTGKSMGVFVDLSGAPASPSNDMATMRPLFLGERGSTEYVTSPPITFVATGPSATIYFEAELDARTPGGPQKTTDVAYMIDNIDLRMVLRGWH